MAPKTAMFRRHPSMDDAHNQFHNAGVVDGVNASFAVGSLPPNHLATVFGALNSGSYDFCTARLCSVLSSPVSSLVTVSLVQS